MIVVDVLFDGRAYYHGPYKEQARRVGARNGHLWCHMSSTGSLEELDTFAKRIGMRPAWRDGDHYDLTPGKRALAVKLGAVEITAEQAIELVRWKRYGADPPGWAQPVQPELL